MSRFFLFLAVSLLTLAPAFGQAREERQTVGLVLSGGGAKGIAHIGVIQALEDNDIPIDYVTGTSMGSIVGALYSMGYTPQEMMELIGSRGFSYWSTGKVDPKLDYYFARQNASPTLFSTGLGSTKNTPADSVPASLISPLPMAFAFMDIFAPYTAQCGGNFDRLFVPFRCVASNMTKKQKHVFASGQLGDAVRASMSYPIVFQPIEIDGDLYYDGGIFDNFPVDVMRQDFKPSIMLGIDVSSIETGPKTTLLDQIDNLVVQSGSHELPADEGIKLRLDLNRFGLLDFPAAKEIYQAGYDKTLEMIDSIKSRVTARAPKAQIESRRAQFKAAIPQLRFKSVNVYGATRHQNEYIQYLFRPHAGRDTIGVDRARDAFYQAIASGTIKGLFPQANYDKRDGLFVMTLKATMKGSWGGSVGGYLTSSSTSFIYAAVDYSTMSFHSINTKLGAWIGQSTMAGQFDAKYYLHTPVPSALSVQAVVSRSKYSETDHMFFDAKQPTFLVEHEYFGRLAWGIATGRLGKIDFGVGYGAVRSSFYRNNRLASYEEGRLYSHENLGQAFARFTSSTLDNLNFPTSGWAYDICAMGLMGTNRTQTYLKTRHKTSPKWVQLEIRTRNYPELSKNFSLGIETDFMLSTRKLLPTYSASISTAPAFCPTPASNNSFNPDFRANSFLAAGLIPIYKINSSLSARIGGYAFVPLRRIDQVAGTDVPRWGRWLSDPEFYGEADISFNLPIGGQITGYVNYSTLKGDKWNVGISLGIYLLPPKFLR